LSSALTFEFLTASYFAALALAATAARVPRRRRLRVAVLSAASAVAIGVGAPMLPLPARAWLGHMYIAAGYWLPALLARAASPTAFESWLLSTDAPWKRLHTAPPLWMASVLELSYLLCYMLVPFGFVTVWLNGDAVDVDRYWSAVLASGFLCYGSIPWLVSRPPRIVEQTAPSRVGRANVYVLGRVSHGLNTFPSGHVAVSIAAALQVWNVRPEAGLVLLVVAAAIAAGAIAGRYHYVIDVLLGVVVGIVAATLL
jgi:membrane-associated phospholipid phosphatase